MSANKPEAAFGMPLPWVQDGRGVEDAKGDLVAMVNIAMPALDAQRIARLIAAAPELLDALRSAEYRLSAMAGVHVPEALDVIRAAIAKAEGK